jgi:hypothetical protein
MRDSMVDPHRPDPTINVRRMIAPFVIPLCRMAVRLAAGGQAATGHGR